MGNVLETNVKLINDKMKFEATAGNNPPIITDYIPPFGDAEGYMPLEIFLISLSTCLGGSISLLIKKMGVGVQNLEIKATGVRREEHPTGFEKITLDVVLYSTNGTDEALQKVIKMSEEKYCPVYAMINEKVDIYINSRVINS